MGESDWGKPIPGGFLMKRSTCTEVNVALLSRLSLRFSRC